MTQHHLAGELSLRLAQLEAFAPVRREAETTPLSELPRVLAHALALGDRLCWDSLARGDIEAFSAQAALCADLYDFGRFAGLMDDR
jgi:hypothetical protein